MYQAGFIYVLLVASKMEHLEDLRGFDLEKMTSSHLCLLCTEFGQSYLSSRAGMAFD